MDIKKKISALLWEIFHLGGIMGGHVPLHGRLSELNLTLSHVTPSVIYSDISTLRFIKSFIFFFSRLLGRALLLCVGLGVLGAGGNIRGSDTLEPFTLL